MKELQKKYLNIGLAPYNIPVTITPTISQSQLTAPHLNQLQMQNYLLGGLQLQNSSGNPILHWTSLTFLKQFQTRLEALLDLQDRISQLVN